MKTELTIAKENLQKIILHKAIQQGIQLVLDINKGLSQSGGKE